MQKRRVAGQLQGSESKHSREPQSKLPFMSMASTMVRIVDKTYGDTMGSLGEPCSLPVQDIIVAELFGNVACLLRWLTTPSRDLIPVTSHTEKIRQARSFCFEQTIAGDGMQIKINRASTFAICNNTVALEQDATLASRMP